MTYNWNKIRTICSFQRKLYFVRFRDSGIEMVNALYYGDNLNVLREHIKDESVDLVYLDPPFNSNANYNVLFKAPGGEQSQAQPRSKPLKTPGTGMMWPSFPLMR